MSPRRAALVCLLCLALRAGAAESVDVDVTFTIAAGAPVTIVDVLTVDLDADGYLDAVRVLCSNPIIDASVDPMDFTVAGVTGLAFAPAAGGDTADDADFHLTFDDGVLDTAATPEVGYTRGSLRSPLGVPVSDRAAAPATDGAGPAILAARALAPDRVAVTFSEPIVDATLVPGELLFAGFATPGVDGNPIALLTGSPDDRHTAAVPAAPLAAGDTGTIRLASVGAVRDAAGIDSDQVAPVPVRRFVPRRLVMAYHQLGSPLVGLEVLVDGVDLHTTDAGGAIDVPDLVDDFDHTVEVITAPAAPQ